MDFTMCVCVGGGLGSDTLVWVWVRQVVFVHWFWVQIFRLHGNHDGFFFFGIDVLDNTRGQQGFPVVFLLSLVLLLFFVVVLAVQQSLDVFFLQSQFLLVGLFVLIDDEQRSVNSPGIGEDLELLFSDISDDGNFWGNLTTSSQLLESGSQMSWVTMDTQPHTVNEHSGGVWGFMWDVVFQRFKTPFFQELRNRIRPGTDGDTRHQRQVLD
ncbi:hypothetical protein WICPIJ_000774 [Wickerhamomyces pijperi]|uniref:Uncharacterized protein n=1 Tax=Wickerhamomyces pijperi TaxID=599730 RepID=A0A9P8TRK5_WICPI|nr:hypothetical protein WICPIJ_000774 [Wickerhamomyces pijperi]